MKLSQQITDIIVHLADLKLSIELLERDDALITEQNLDLRKRLKKMQPVGRNE